MQIDKVVYWNRWFQGFGYDEGRALNSRDSVVHIVAVKHSLTVCGRLEYQPVITLRAFSHILQHLQLLMMGLKIHCRCEQIQLPCSMNLHYWQQRQALHEVDNIITLGTYIQALINTHTRIVLKFATHHASESSSRRFCRFICHGLLQLLQLAAIMVTKNNIRVYILMNTIGYVLS